jgi:hypothetical protein
VVFIEKNCLNCSNLFQTEEKYIKRGHGKFCCFNCSIRYRSKLPKKAYIPNVTCSLCGKKFFKRESNKANSKSGLFFCCREHKDLAQRIGGIIEIMPGHYGTGNGINKYRENAISKFGVKCDLCGWDKHIAGIVVHHKDRNRSNNSIDNLQVMCACCHAIEHWGNSCSNDELIDQLKKAS